MYPTMYPSMLVALTTLGWAWASASSASDCELVTVGDWAGKCQQFNLTGLPSSTAIVMDDYPEPYLVSSPCHDTNVADCKVAMSPSPTLRGGAVSFGELEGSW